MDRSVLNSDLFPRPTRWLEGYQGAVLAFLWGFGEATVFFILPDVLLSFVAIFRPRRSLLHCGAILAGAVLGGALIFVWAGRSSQARDMVAKVPAVTPSMFTRATGDLQDYGAKGTCLGPVRGIPYKVYAVEAPGYTSFASFVLWTIPARSWRFVAVWLGFSGAGMVLRRMRRGALAPALHALFWIVTYAIYWSHVK